MNLLISAVGRWLAVALFGGLELTVRPNYCRSKPSEIRLDGKIGVDSLNSLHQVIRQDPSTNRSLLDLLEDSLSNSLFYHKIPRWQASSRILSNDKACVTSLTLLNHSGGPVKLT